jgi:uncharacterized cupin superfamily protein
MASDMTDYAKKNLNEVEDAAVEGGFSENQMARFAGKDLGCETIGLALEAVKAGRRQSFGHKHEEDEEVYVVIAGSGRMKLGEEIIEIRPMDAIRVAPGVTRSFEAGDEDLTYLAFGSHHDGDGELDFEFWDA